MKVIFVKADDEFHEEINRVAKSQPDRNVSQFVREAIRDKIRRERQRNPHILAKSEGEVQMA